MIVRNYETREAKPKGYPVKRRSRKEIEDAAFLLRRQVGLATEWCFPIMRYIECFLPKLRPGFSLEIYGQDDKDARYPGITETQSNLIRLREDVYDLARKGAGWARGIAAHELGHLLLGHEVLFAKLSGEPTHDFSEDSEWQANVFYGGLLAPPRMTKHLSAEELEQKCGISHNAAKYAVSRRENRKNGYF